MSSCLFGRNKFCNFFLGNCRFLAILCIFEVFKWDTDVSCICWNSRHRDITYNFCIVAFFCGRGNLCMDDRFLVHEDFLEKLANVTSKQFMHLILTISAVFW